MIMLMGHLLHGDELAPAPTPVNPWLLSSSDLKDAASLAHKLRAAQDPLTRYIAERCGVLTKQLLNAYQDQANPDPRLRQMLLRDINRLLQEDTLYDANRFTGIALSPETSKLVAEQDGANRLLLNRRLLEDAFPEELIRVASVPLQVQADILELEGAQQLALASGHVHIHKETENLRCDHAVINLQTLDVVADGNVAFERGSDLWVGDKLRYNFQNHAGDFGGFTAYLAPFYVRAKTSYQTSEREYVLEKVQLTPCEGEHPKAYLYARKARIDPGHHIRASHVVLYVGGVPVMYAPYWSQNLGDPNFISMVPGYSRRMWVYLLTAFNYRITKKVEMASHVDLRMRRGIAIGQDLMWSASGNAKGLSTERYMKTAPEGPWSFLSRNNWTELESQQQIADDEDAWFGDAIAYYAQDAWPNEGKAQSIDEERYRMRLYHSHNLGDHDYFLAQLNYLSDPKIIEQYFREEYKAAPEPDNYIVLGHRADHYALSLEIDQRLNDFFSSLNRSPLLTLDISRQAIGDSPFYYQGKTTAGYFSQEWKSQETNQQDYSAFRFDTDHMIYYPNKLFGFLTLTPRIGYRGTWYSATRRDHNNSLAQPLPDKAATPAISNGVPETSSTTNILTERLGAQYRNLGQFGVESSLKAFKIWETYPGDVINDVRHIAEPYLNYTLVPKPNLASNSLYQFDGGDALGMENDIRFGMRNKIQTKRRSIYELIYLDVFTRYRLEREENQNAFSNIAFEVRSTPFDWLKLKIDGEYDAYEQSWQALNTRLTLLDHTFWSYDLEHRYKESASSLLYNAFTIAPNVNWSFTIYCRYELEDDSKLALPGLEECGLSVQRSFGCLTARIGMDWRREENPQGGNDNDYDVWLQFWFTDFPKVRVDAGL